jgi:hypothetical protein
MRRRLEVSSLQAMFTDAIDQLLTKLNRTLIRHKLGAELFERERLLEMRVIEGGRLILPSSSSADV